MLGWFGNTEKVIGIMALSHYVGLTVSGAWKACHLH